MRPNISICFWKAAIAAGLAGICLAVLPVSGRAQAAAPTVRLLGVVTGLQGRPRSGARVRLRSLAEGKEWRSMSGPSGAFLIASLPPGLYLLQAEAPGLWASRRVRVQAGQPLLLQLRLRKLPSGKKPAALRGHYKWLLRETAAQRPILQLRSGSHPAARRASRFNGQVSMLAGTGGQAFSGSSAVATSFDVNTLLASNVLLGFSGDMGMTGSANPGANSSLQADLAPQGDWAWAGHVQIGLRQIAAPLFLPSPEMRLYTLQYGNQWQITHRLGLEYGVALSALAASRSLQQINPYLGLQYRLRHGLQLQYQLIAAPPPTAWEQNGGLEMANPMPRLSLLQGRPEMEKASHQQITLQDALTPTTDLEVAWFMDQFQHTVVNGSWQGSQPQELVTAGAILPDVYSNLFSADGGHYGGSGELFQITQQMDGGMRLSAGMASGPTLSLAERRMRSNDMAALLQSKTTPSFFVLWSGTMPWSHTRWRCSYETASANSLTPVAPYAGFNRQPYANVFLRQPLPSLIPDWSGKIDMLLEMQNLLAQGYVPVLTPDGHLVYMIQSARTLRGGVSFHF